eukprot:2454-Heterococcus_DN1.PRE.4
MERYAAAVKHFLTIITTLESEAAQAKLQDAQLNTHTAATTITSVTAPVARSVLADGCTIEECRFQASVCLYKLKRHAEALALMTSESSSSSSATPVINNARAFQLQGLVHHDYGQYAKAVKLAPLAHAIYYTARYGVIFSLAECMQIALAYSIYRDVSAQCATRHMISCIQ